MRYWIGQKFKVIKKHHDATAPKWASAGRKVKVAAFHPTQKNYPGFQGINGEKFDATEKHGPGIRDCVWGLTEYIEEIGFNYYNYNV